METSNWPPSNYPIFFALILLVATAIVLAMGDEELAEELAIYAYYLLVIGVTIRFLELTLPDSTPEKLRAAKTRVLIWAGRAKVTGSKGFCHLKQFSHRINIAFRKVPVLKYIDRINITESKVICRLKQSRYRLNIESRKKPVLKRSTIQSVQKISKEVALNLAILFVILCIYGLMFGWWIIMGYLEKIALVIVTLFSLYILSTVFLKQSYKT